MQALKAGIMEIADIFVINKADRDGADRLAQSVAAMLALQAFQPGDWRPPILKTEATTGMGVPELIAAIAKFRAHSEAARARAGARDRYTGCVILLSHRFLSSSSRRCLPANCSA